MSNKIIVTGGSGFIGRNLLPKLAAKYKVMAPSHAQCDLLRPESLKKWFNKVDVVIHLAGIAGVQYSITHPAEVISKNLAMTLNLLEALRLNKQRPLCIFASTDRVYGSASYPIEPYTASKVLGETVFKTYSALYDIPYIIFRLDAAYGPNQPRRMFVADVIQKMISGNEITVGSLSAYRNFIHVDDVVNAFLKAVNASPKAWNATYDIGGRECVSFKQVLLLMKKKIENKLDKKIRAGVDSKVLARRSVSEMSAPFSLSLKKTAARLDWKPRFNLDRGLDNTIDWFMKNGKK